MCPFYIFNYALSSMQTEVVFPCLPTTYSNRKKAQFPKSEPNPAKSVLCTRGKKNPTSPGSPTQLQMPTQDRHSSSVSAVPAQWWKWAITSLLLGAGLSLRPAPNPIWACCCQCHWLCPVLSNYLLRGRKQGKCGLCSPRAAVTHSGSLVTLWQSPALCEPQTQVTQGNHSPNSTKNPSADRIRPTPPGFGWKTCRQNFRVTSKADEKTFSVHTALSHFSREYCV